MGKIESNQSFGPTVRLLYLGEAKEDNKGIMLRSAIKDSVENVDQFIPGAKELFNQEIAPDLEEIISKFNNDLIGSLGKKDKIEVEPMPYPKDAPALKPSKDDYLGKAAPKSQEEVYPGNGTTTDPWQNIMRVDGKTFPISVLRGGAINLFGMPEAMLLQKDSNGKMELQPLGEKDGKPFYFYKDVPYMDPDTGEEKKGLYYKFKETTNSGKSGENGIIVPQELTPHVVVEAEEITKEQYDERIKNGKGAVSVNDPGGKKYFAPTKAYFIGVKESQKLVDGSATFPLDVDA